MTGLFGPPDGKRAIVFIDDLNMPASQPSGAQPPIELLRQWIDQGGWYPPGKLGFFTRVVDMVGVYAMGPPGGGRNLLTVRFMRHLNMVSCPDPTDAVVQQIFEHILASSMQTRGLKQAFVEMSSAIVAATVGAYNVVKAEMLPTPVKSHYTFNLRDVARVVQGIMLADASTFEEPTDLMLLWAHEFLRVFYDRLVDDADRSCVLDRMRALCRIHFVSQDGTPISIDELMAPFDANNNKTFDDEDVGLLLYLPQPALFGGPGTPYTYQHVKDLKQIDALQQTLTRRLAEYNRVEPVAMHLVLFPFAIEHICRISRVLLMPEGHAILVGLQGSGRQSLTQLSAYYLGLSVFHASECNAGGGLSTWKTDMKRLLRQAGVTGRTTVLILSDTEIVDEGQLEDISGLLIRGEVPNLFGAEEMARIVEQLPHDADSRQSGDVTASLVTPARLTDLESRELFARRCRARIHVVLAISPEGDKLRTRCRMYPALVNNSVIIWFRSWPTNAFEAVATALLRDELLSPKDTSSRPKNQTESGKATVDRIEETDQQLTEMNARSAIKICARIHQSAQELCEQYVRTTGRLVYVFPSSFLTLVETYRRLLQQQRKEISRSQKRYRTGLRQLEAAEARVSDLQQDLTEQGKMIDEQKNNQLLRTHEALKDEVQSIWRSKYEKCKLQIMVGQKLISDLSDEKIRWEASLRALSPRYEGLLGDMLLAAAFVTYLGALTADVRWQAIEQWRQLCICNGLPTVSTSSFSLAGLLADPMTLQKWALQGLPADDFSIESGVIVSVTSRWPFFIDPELTATKWVRAMETKGELAREGATGLMVVRLAQPDLIDKLHFAVTIGEAVLIEDMGETTDPVIAPLVSMRYFKKGGIEHVQIGLKAVEVHKHFRLFLQTKLPNPRLAPELQACVTLLAFMITPASLEAQLLHILIAKDRPDLSAQHEKWMSTLSAHELQLKVKEDNILDSLATSEGGAILEDTAAVKSLTEAKALWREIGNAKGAAHQAEAQIRRLRDAYRPAAAFARTLYFCVVELYQLDSMYAHSLAWFKEHFCGSIACTQEVHGTAVADMTSWNRALRMHLQLQVCQRVSRGISQTKGHRHVFALQLCHSVLSADGSLDPHEWRHFVTRGALAASPSSPVANPAPDWLSDRVWGNVVRLAQLPFAQACDFLSHFGANASAYRPFYEHMEPHTAFHLLPKPPAEWSPFRKLLLLHALRFDKCVPGVGVLIAQMPEFFGPSLLPLLEASVTAKRSPTIPRQQSTELPFDPPTPNTQDMGQTFQDAFDDSSASTPIVCILSPGSDPVDGILELAKVVSDEEPTSISLGQGQGAICLQLLAQVSVKGGWAIVMNCHLGESFMPQLEKFVSELKHRPRSTSANGGSVEDITRSGSGVTAALPLHPSFRLWMTSMPSPKFPISVLHVSTKFISEASGSTIQSSMASALTAVYSTPELSDPADFVSSARLEPLATKVLRQRCCSRWNGGYSPSPHVRRI